MTNGQALGHCRLGLTNMTNTCSNGWVEGTEKDRFDSWFIPAQAEEITTGRDHKDMQCRREEGGVGD